MPDKIRKAIDKSNLSIELIAIKSGVSKATLFMWLSGGRTPSLRLLQKLANALGVDIKELL